MKVLVCGGRNYRDVDTVYKTLDGIAVTAVITGCARGADSIALMWSDERGVPVTMYAADWDLYGPGAGHMRNRRMLTEGKPDMVVAFPGGRGTADMVRRANEAGVKVVRIGETAENATGKAGK